MIMETKICKTCGRELPVTSFRLSKGGTKVATCNECINEKRAESRYKHTQIGGVKPLPFPIPTSTASSPWRSYSL